MYVLQTLPAMCEQTPALEYGKQMIASLSDESLLYFLQFNSQESLLPDMERSCNKMHNGKSQDVFMCNIVMVAKPDIPLHRNSIQSKVGPFSIKQCILYQYKEVSRRPTMTWTIWDGLQLPQTSGQSTICRK